MWGDFQSESFRLNVRRTMVESDQTLELIKKVLPAKDWLTMLINLEGRWLTESWVGKESSWIPITCWGWKGEGAWLIEFRTETRDHMSRRQREGWCKQIRARGGRDSGGLQSNPCLSHCALITLERSEKHSATGWPSLTPFHSTGSDQMIWFEPRGPERGSAPHCTSNRGNTVIVQHSLNSTHDGKCKCHTRCYCYSYAWTVTFTLKMCCYDPKSNPKPEKYVIDKCDT